jgi:aminoglycoside phosphotransferase
LWKKVEALLGEIVLREETPGQHSHSHVFRLTAGGGSVYFLKQAASSRGFTQELAFYRDIAPQISKCPRLVEVFEEQRTFLVTALEGEPVSLGRFTFSERERAYRSAGAFLRALHSQPCETDNLELGEALLMRVAAFARQARKSFSEEEVQGVVRPLEGHLSQVKGLSRVFCHRDFMEHNWLMSRDTFGVIDFEHSKADFFLLDLCEMAATSWLTSPGLGVAFFEGYGRRLEVWEKEFLHYWALLWSYSTLMWARRHNDDRYRVIGERAVSLLQHRDRPNL